MTTRIRDLSTVHVCVIIVSELGALITYYKVRTSAQFLP